jgi:hypothetical protein
MTPMVQWLMFSKNGLVAVCLLKIVIWFLKIVWFGILFKLSLVWYPVCLSEYILVWYIV